MKTLKLLLVFAVLIIVSQIGLSQTTKTYDVDAQGNAMKVESESSPINLYCCLENNIVSRKGFQLTVDWWFLFALISVGFMSIACVSRSRQNSDKYVFLYLDLVAVVFAALALVAFEFAFSTAITNIGLMVLLGLVPILAALVAMFAVEFIDNKIIANIFILLYYICIFVDCLFIYGIISLLKLWRCVGAFFVGEKEYIIGSTSVNNSQIFIW